MSEQVVVFKLADQEYGIDIMRVIEIDNVQNVRLVPELPSYIEGIVNVRGEIYPIYDLRKRFKLKTQSEGAESKFIYMRLDDIQVGFRVDSVCEILSISPDNIEPTPKMISKYDSKYITGVTKKDGRMILLLDIELLVSDEDQQKISEVI
ncbi:MAG: chemotaxis protein CheW [Cellulosilyticaceae bacterium]